MKVVSKLQDDLTFSLDNLELIISERIRSAQKKSNFSLSRFKTTAFENSLNKILQVPFPLSFVEKLVLLLEVAPYIKPVFLDDFQAKALSKGNILKNFGGIKLKQHFGLLTTGETALFILAGTNPSRGRKYQKLFDCDANPGLLSLLKIQPVPKGEPVKNGHLLPEIDWLEKILPDMEVAPSNIDKRTYNGASENKVEKNN